MGKKSREKKQRKADGIKGKLLKQMRRNSETNLVQTPDGNMMAFNPVKKLAAGEMYKDNTGLDVMNVTVQQYAAYMQQQMEKAKALKENKKEGVNDEK